MMWFRSDKAVRDGIFFTMALLVQFARLVLCENWGVPCERSWDGERSVPEAAHFGTGKALVRLLGS